MNDNKKKLKNRETNLHNHDSKHTMKFNIIY